MMFKISEFSKYSRVSARALRLYDRLNLLKPVYVDPATSYRYYSAEQLSRLNRIIAFKDLGFSLEQIAELLSEKVPPTQMRGMLRLKQAEVEEQIATEQRRLARIEARLQLIEQEEMASPYEVILKSIAPQHVASRRERLPNCTQIKSLHHQLALDLKRQEVPITGFPQTIWYDPEYQLHNVDAEVIAPIDLPKKSLQNITLRQLPGIEQMASVIHHGSEDTLIQACHALLRWIEANHYCIVGSSREIYLHDQPHYSVTEVQFPIQAS